MIHFFQLTRLSSFFSTRGDALLLLLYPPSYIKNMISIHSQQQQQNKALTLDDSAGTGSGAFKQAWIKFFPSGLVTIGCSLTVVKVYTSPVSETTKRSTWVPVNVLNS